MTIETLTRFLMWCAVIHVTLYALAVLFATFARGLIHSWHGRMFGLPPEALDKALYGYLGVYKALILIFAVVPYVALRIVGGG